VLLPIADRAFSADDGEQVAKHVEYIEMTERGIETFREARRALLVKRRTGRLPRVFLSPLPSARQNLVPTALSRKNL